MESIQLILFFVVFVVMSILMFLRKLPALIALPVMAFLISIIGGVSTIDTIQYVIGQGSLRLYNAFTIAIFGSMLSVILQKTGVAESFIKKGAELSGDNPWFIAVIMLSLIILLFTTIGGLGAIIMVATIVLPIMSSVGISPLTTVGIFLLGLSIGGILNIGNWAVYISVMGLTVDDVRPFALIMFGITFITALVYITIQLYRDGHDINLKIIILRTLVVIAVLALLVLIYQNILSESLKTGLNVLLTNVGTILKYIIAIGIISLFVYNLLRLLIKSSDKDVNWSSYFTPIIPLFLILIFNLDFIASFIVGLIYCFLSTYKKGRLNLFIRSVFEGGGMVMPAVVLMFGIGMLLNAIMGPPVQLNSYPDGWPVLNLLHPVMKKIVPTNAIMYVIIFTIFAPLALYRGPLNVWGMGYGIATLFLASGMDPGSVMGLLMAVGQIQGISDPTNTQNVWLANEMRVDVQKILWNTIPYTWIVAFLGLVASALIFLN